MKLQPATPVTHQRGTFVTRPRGSQLEDVRTPVYTVPAPAIQIHSLRKERGIGLRDAAAALGIRAVELSGLERGRLVPEDPSEWLLMASKIKKLVAIRIVVQGA